MGDLDDLMSEYEADTNVEMPHHFEEVVDIAVENERDKADKIQDAMEEFGQDSKQFEEAMEDLAADEANPFWKRLLEPEKAYGANIELAPIMEKALQSGMAASIRTQGFENFVKTQTNVNNN